MNGPYWNGPPPPNASGPGTWPFLNTPHRMLLLPLCRAQFSPTLNLALTHACAGRSLIASAHRVSRPIDRTFFMVFSLLDMGPTCLSEGHLALRLLVVGHLNIAHKRRSSQRHLRILRK